MELAILSTIPPVLSGTTLAGLLGPLSVLALGAVIVTLGVLVAGMIAEGREARAMAEALERAAVVTFPGRARGDRAAA